jgi:hypothetical protein
MRIYYAAALLILSATPAFSQSTKTDNGVLVECKLTGSGDSGFDITGDNKQGSVDKSCSATCKLTKADKSTMEKSYTTKVGKGLKNWIGGEASVSGAPLKSPTLTSASCKDLPAPK